MTGSEYADQIASYLSKRFGSRGLKVYQEVRVGKSIIGKNRCIDVFCVSESDKKAFAIEDKFHNPTAEVVYDILAMRGGARLYSRLSPLQMWAIEASGPPTAGMQAVLAEQEKELAAIEAELKAFLAGDVAKLNQRAAQQGLGYVIIK